MPSGSTQSTDAREAPVIAFTLPMRKFVYLSAASMPRSHKSASTKIRFLYFSAAFFIALRSSLGSALPSGEESVSF